MFKRKLAALDYQSEEPFDCEDEQQFRTLVLWLEEQKIRHLRIEDRDPLRVTHSPEWEKGYQQYKNNLGCPISSGKRKEEVDWLLSYAIRLEYSDEVKKYKDVKKTPTSQSNPLESIDINSEDFKGGVYKLAKMLNVACHPDHLLTLSAISKIITSRLNPDAISNPETVIIKGVECPLNHADIGLEEIGDPTIGQAVQIMRLLYLKDLRHLQTSINETIVALQGFTADPKTDIAMGKVGY
ncbi:Hypothetical predicted protein [Cloeon dipterum]|uniref:RNA transcription, translation and transport factor protein n=1 Tax=Cloeon dipterum TaxID=197152 RepID=A0A8S1D8U5_9INSE|nr:Hypothetical predicted protein [Cloeon dipterum]